MPYRTTFMLLLAPLVAVTAASAQQGNLPGGIQALQEEIDALAQRVSTLESALSDAQSQIETLEAVVVTIQENAVLDLGPFVTVTADSLNGLTGPHILLEGANVHVRSGSGSTWDDSTWGDENLTGLGNLLVGYNEGRTASVRTGSHNLVVGWFHDFTSYGSFVAGDSNRITGPSTSVAGGVGNEASGWAAAVAGGQNNLASGDYCSVGGGERNEAAGFGSVVTGGHFNSTDFLSVFASVTGGLQNYAAEDWSTVSGGRQNQALEDWSTVSGGYQRIAVGRYDWVAGSLFEDE